MVPLREILLVLTDSFLPKVGSKVSVDPVTLISTNSFFFFFFFWHFLESYVKNKNPGKSVLFFPELTYAFIAFGKDFGRDGKEVFLSSGASMYRALS